MRPNRNRRLLLLAGLVVAADQISKTWAMAALDGGRTVDIVWTLRLALGLNSGMAFSRAKGIGPLIGVTATLVMAVVVRRLRHEKNGTAAVGLALVAAGAAGNIADRLFRGRGWMRGSVVDFIDLQWWPAFNVADASITVGAVLIIAVALFGGTSRSAGARA